MRKSTIAMLATLGTSFNLSAMILALLVHNVVLEIASMVFFAVSINIVFSLAKELDKEPSNETKAS